MVLISRSRVLHSVPVAAVAGALRTGLRRTAFATTLMFLLPGSGRRTWTAVVNRL